MCVSSARLCWSGIDDDFAAARRRRMAEESTMDDDEEATEVRRSHCSSRPAGAAAAKAQCQQSLGSDQQRQGQCGINARFALAASNRGSLAASNWRAYSCSDARYSHCCSTITLMHRSSAMFILLQTNAGASAAHATCHGSLLFPACTR